MRIGSALMVVLLSLMLLAMPALAQDDLTGSIGTGNVGVADESGSLTDAAIAAPPVPSNTESAPPTSMDGSAAGGEQETADGGAPASGGDDGQGEIGTIADTQGTTEGTEEVTAPPSGDGSEIFQTPDVGAAPEAEIAASPAAESGDEADPGVEPATHIVTVTVYNCESDPGANDPAGTGDCAPVEGAVVNATVGLDVVSSATTDAAGQALMEIEEGQTVQISQEASTITSGYMAMASSKEVTSANGAATYLVNVRDASLGRFQIASGQCFTLDDPRVEMLVVGPMVRAAAQACGPLGGAEFTLSGGPSASTQTLVTNGAGSWTGYLEPGSYSLSRGETAVNFEIQAGAITAVVSVDYVTGPSGTLLVERYYCTDGDTNGVVVSVYPGGGGGAPNASCVLNSGNVELYSLGGGSSAVLDLQGGSITVDIAADMGDEYVVRDSSGVESAPFLLGEGESVQVVIAEIRVLGSVSAQLFHCDDPASNFEDATLTGYWEAACGASAAGITVTLRDSAGTVISADQTDSAGGVSFADLAPGTYTLSTSDFCAAFTGGVDVRAGFEVIAKANAAVAMYSCAKPSPPPPPDGENNTGGNGSEGNGSSGGNSTGEGGIEGPAQEVPDNGSTGGALGAVPTELFSIGQFQPTLLPAPKPKLYVLNLPGVGTGTKASPSGGDHALALVVAAVALAGCLGMFGRRVLREPEPVRSRRRM